MITGQAWILRCGTLWPESDYRSLYDIGRFAGTVAEFAQRAYRKTGIVEDVLIKDFDAERYFIGTASHELFGVTEIWP